MTPPVSAGPCPSCGGRLLVPGFALRPVAPRCESCADAPGLAAARAEVRTAYAGAEARDIALAFSSNAGQFLTALLNGERAPARAFLANAIALGEMLLDG